MRPLIRAQNEPVPPLIDVQLDSLGWATGLPSCAACPPANVTAAHAIGQEQLKVVHCNSHQVLSPGAVDPNRQFLLLESA